MSVNLVPTHIDVCSTCGYGAPREFYPCYRCGQVGTTRFVPEGDDEAVERAARGLCEYGVLTVDGEVATWERHSRKLTQMATIALACAGAQQDAAAGPEAPES